MEPFLRITLDDIIGLTILFVIAGLFFLAWLSSKWHQFREWAGFPKRHGRLCKSCRAMRQVSVYSGKCDECRATGDTQ